ncbi:leucine rich repeats family protein, partial [Chlamydia psittaci 02DC14]
ELTYVILNGGLISIGSEAFKSTGLTAVVLPETVELIGSGAFENCSKLEHLLLNDKLIQIGREAFARTG